MKNPVKKIIFNYFSYLYFRKCILRKIGFFCGFAFVFTLVFTLISCSNAMDVIATPNTTLRITVSDHLLNEQIQGGEPWNYFISVFDTEDGSAVLSRIITIPADHSINSVSCVFVPGNYSLTCIVSDHETVNENNEYEYSVYGIFRVNFSMNPYEEKELDIDCFPFSQRETRMECSLIDPDRLQVNAKVIYPGICSLLENCFYFYSYYLYFDCDQDGDKDKTIRILKDMHVYETEDTLSFSVILDFEDGCDHSGDIVSLYQRIGIKVKTTNFTGDFYDENSIYKIYWAVEYEFINNFTI